MESKSTPLSENIGEAIGYLDIIIDRKVQLFKLEAAERISKSVASLTTGFLLLIIILPIVLFVFSISAGLWLADTFNWSYTGSFFVLSLFYMLIGVILIFARRPLITNPILTVVIRELFKKEENEIIKNQ